VEAPGIIKRSAALESACMEARQWVDGRFVFAPSKLAFVQISCPVKEFKAPVGEADLCCTMKVGQVALAQILEAVEMQERVVVVEAKLFVACMVLEKEPMALFEELKSIREQAIESGRSSIGHLKDAGQLGDVCLVPADAVADESHQLAWALRALCVM
jgi:hypothetical protein